VLAIALDVACGAGSRPPPLGDQLVDGGTVSDDGGPVLTGDGGLVERSCGVGPDGGVCACADETLLGDPPTLYYVLDRSGSMNDLNKWTTVRGVLEKIMVALGPRARVGAAVFPDPKQDACAPGVEVFPPARGDSPAGTPGPNDLALAAKLSPITAYGGTPTAATLKKLAPAIEAIGGKTYVVLATDGGPNCDAAASCSFDTCTDNIENAPGCPPTGPTNCCAPANAGPLACLDAQPTVDAVAALANAGIPVYVVGVPGSKPYATLLDQLAVAGGTARASEPLYYDVSSADSATLLAAMSTIAAKITASCIIVLDQVPPDPSLINVYLDGAVLPQSGPDGWTLDGDVVTILGATCQSITDGHVLDVRVVAGCPTVTQ
jgi:hypothetical protein